MDKESKNLAQEESERIFSDQVKTLYSHQLIGMIASILNGVILVAALWRYFPGFLLPWFVMLLAITSVRVVNLWLYRKAEDKCLRAREWGRKFLIGMGSIGICWGLSAIWIFQIKAIEYHLLICFVVGGMVAGAAATLSALRSAFYAFSIPALLPLIISFFIVDDPPHIAMGFMLILYAILISITANNMYRVIRRSFQLRLEKNDLITRLEQSRGEMERINEALRYENLERQKAEQDIRSLNDNLEKEISLRTLDLERINRELNDFSYSVSHDLRAPLRAIEGFSQVIRKDFSEKMDPAVLPYLEKIIKSAGRMNDLINDLLLLSRVSKQDLELGNYDISHIVHEIIADLQTAQSERKVNFSIQEDIKACCDLRLLRVALENLLRNSWKFTSKTPHAKIGFGVIREKERSVFFVTDNGVGFNMAYSEKLFIPFQRLHSESEFEGTGVGLATVQRIIHRHGGAIWAEAEMGKGATFFFTLSEKCADAR